MALVDIANRGRLSALGFNRGGRGPYGDGFLMKEGYTVVWVGWEFDVPEGRPIRFAVPEVDGKPVGGLGFAAVRDTAAWIKHDPRRRGDGRARPLVRLVAERPLICGRSSTSASTPIPPGGRSSTG